MLKEQIAICADFHTVRAHRQYDIEHQSDPSDETLASSYTWLLVIFNLKDLLDILEDSELLRILSGSNGSQDSSVSFWSTETCCKYYLWQKKNRREIYYMKGV